MTFEPSRLLPPMGGNNLNTRVSSLRSMNGLEPTPEQLAELGHKFSLHAMNVRTSLGGFLVRDGELSDGSRFRFVSNSGIHQQMIWPAGGPPENPALLADWFRAIPSSDSFRNGASGVKPSEGWKLPDKLEELSSWPVKHKAIGLRVDHPGHVTWTNPSLKLNQKPIVVSWRGPRDRYAATTGFAGAAGGAITAHERNPDNIPTLFTPLQLALDVLIDTGFVWINGHKVNTGVPKVIAACLHQWDPSGHPGEFVLRVCADRTIASTTRQMVVYDLVPTAGATGAALKSFAKATSALSVKATYLAADNTNAANPGGGSPGAGKWDYWQRPHFNKSGTRLATLICKVGADGSSRESHAVSFDPTTWAIVDDVSTSITVTGVTNDFSSAFSPWSATDTDQQNYFVACDFEADVFVYVRLTVLVQRTQSGVSQGSLAPSVYGGTQDRSRTTTYTIEHSVLGTLKTWTSTDVLHMEYHAVSVTGGTHYTGNFHWDIANATAETIARARSGKPIEIAFIGDLSKKVFAVGYPKQTDSHYNMAGSLDVVASSSTPPVVPVTASRARSFLLFDVYFDGTKIVTAGTGGFTPTATESSSGGYSEQMDLADQLPDPVRTSTTNTNGAIARYAVATGGSPIGPPSYEGRFGSDSETLRCAIYLFGAAPEFQHIAVHPEKAAAYVGAAFYKNNTTYGGSTPVPHGLELTIVKPSTTAIIANPAAYITGAHPTLSAPVFMGLSAKSGKTT